MKEVETIEAALEKGACIHIHLIGKLTYLEVCNARAWKVNALKFAVDK